MTAPCSASTLPLGRSWWLLERCWTSTLTRRTRLAISSSRSGTRSMTMTLPYRESIQTLDPKTPSMWWSPSPMWTKPLRLLLSTGGATSLTFAENINEPVPCLMDGDNTYDCGRIPKKLCGGDVLPVGRRRQRVPNHGWYANLHVGCRTMKTLVTLTGTTGTR